MQWVTIGHNVRGKKSHTHPEESNYQFVTLSDLKVSDTKIWKINYKRKTAESEVTYFSR